MLFADLLGVALQTTDQGPAVDDMFFLLGYREGSLVVPSEAVGADQLLERLQQLPGFDNEAVVSASASMHNEIFLCWDRRGMSAQSPD